MTRTTPLRRITLQLRHIFLTDAATFISFSKSLGAEHDACPAQVVRRQLDRDLVARQDADVVHAHLSRDVAEHDMAVFQLHTERGVGQVLENLALHLNDIVFRHAFRVGVLRSVFVNGWMGGELQLALKLAFLSSDSYCWLIT